MSIDQLCMRNSRGHNSFKKNYSSQATISNSLESCKSAKKFIPRLTRKSWLKQETDVIRVPLLSISLTDLPYGSFWKLDGNTSLKICIRSLAVSVLALNIHYPCTKGFKNGVNNRVQIYKVILYAMLWLFKRIFSLILRTHNRWFNPLLSADPNAAGKF